ncbi:MAG: RNA-directed DNA polymerase [Bifidobacteriaceae bacterium]|jgi:hypothetical protein|nr:RNA-directed DNA polymerase [Bifidobacteriaceae bacterium]
MAKEFFLRSANYSTIQLPEYYDFTTILNEIDEAIQDKDVYFTKCKEMKNATDKCPNETHMHTPEKPILSEDVNYRLSSNKDGSLAWRPLEIINPFLYVDLVNTITEFKNWETIKERFIEFSKYGIKCESIPKWTHEKPVVQTLNTTCSLSKVEQDSLRYALDFKYLFYADIANCYGSIYTHSIAWAIETKEVAAPKWNDYTLLGNKVDQRIRNMRQGQTNGIPQGSVLMDFIAELVLGYVDTKIHTKISDSFKDYPYYRIVRYRDDYRVFTEEYDVGVNIMKTISLELEEFGLRLNALKTKESDDIVLSAIKPEKIDDLFVVKEKNTLVERLLSVYKFADQHHNTKILCKLLDVIYEDISLELFDEELSKEQNAEISISIITNLLSRHPITIAINSAILSLLISKLAYWRQEPVINQVYEKIKEVSNSAEHEIWLQRITSKYGLKLDYGAEITNIVKSEINGNHSEPLWDCSWLPNTIQDVFANNKIFILETWQSMNELIMEKEVRSMRSLADYE